MKVSIRSIAFGWVIACLVGAAFLCSKKPDPYPHDRLRSPLPWAKAIDVTASPLRELPLASNALLLAPDGSHVAVCLPKTDETWLRSDRWRVAAVDGGESAEFRGDELVFVDGGRVLVATHLDGGTELHVEAVGGQGPSAWRLRLPGVRIRDLVIDDRGAWAANAMGGVKDGFETIWGHVGDSAVDRLFIETGKRGPDDGPPFMSFLSVPKAAVYCMGSAIFRRDGTGEHELLRTELVPAWIADYQRLGEPVLLATALPGRPKGGTHIWRQDVWTGELKPIAALDFEPYLFSLSGDGTLTVRPSNLREKALWVVATQSDPARVRRVPYPVPDPRFYVTVGNLLAVTPFREDKVLLYRLSQ